MSKNKFARMSVVFLPMLVAAYCIGCCPGKGKEGPAPSAEKGSTAKIGDKIRVGDCEFKILEALKKTSLAHYDTGKERKPNGVFIQVHGSILNRSGSVKNIIDPLVVIDSGGRKYESLEEQDDYLPEAYLSLWTDIKPNKEMKWGAIFELPLDKLAGLQLELKDLGVTSGQATTMVDLGF